MATMLHEMRKSKAYSGAICPKAILCDYRHDFERSNRSAKVEACTQCGRKQVYMIKNGRIDDARYGRNHIRDTIQRGSGIFEMIYGKPKEVKAPISKERSSRELIESSKDVMRRAMRLENQGRL